MITYQLRVPTTRALDQWVDELSWAVWDELAHHTALDSLGAHAFVRIREILHALFQTHVVAYRSCGLWSFCRAGTRPSPWMPETAYRPADEAVHWYLLEVPETLEALVAEAADRVAEFLDCFAGGALPRSVMDSAVEIGLRRGVGRYLYEHPQCGTHPLCAGRVALNPWQEADDPAVGAAHE